MPPTHTRRSRSATEAAARLTRWNERLRQRQDEVTAFARRELDRLGPPSRIVEACRHAVLVTPSNRVRAILTLGAGEAAGVGADVSLAAVAVEFIVSAAKAVDDFPVMDDSIERGGKQSVHAAFGPGTALLASYALIAAAYRSLQECADTLARSDLPRAQESYERLALVVANLSDSIGARGAALGQLRDLANQPPVDEPALLEVIDLKTANLYAMAATAGWLLGGGAIEHLHTLQAAARHLGRGMQIKDDLEDAAGDAATGRRCNYANECSPALARVRLRAELDGYEGGLRSLGGERSTLEALALPICLSLRTSEPAAPTDC